MKGQLCRIFLFLSLAILAVCLPAQAAHAVQSGLSSPMNDHDTQVNIISSGLSAGITPESVGKALEINIGSSALSQSLVQPARQETISGKDQDRSGATDKSATNRLVNTKTVSSPSSGLSGDISDRSDLGSNERTDAAGGTGSPQETEEENAASTPYAQERSKESGRLAGMMISPGGVPVSPDLHSGTRTAICLCRVPIMDHRRSGNNTDHPHNPVVIPAVLHRQAPLPPASGQSRDEAKEDTPSRQRSKRIGILSRIFEPIVSDPASSSFPLQLLFPFNLLLFGGFRRISKKNVLEHDARQVIYQTITASPGIDVKTLTNMTGINENTLRYHLDILATNRKDRLFYPSGVVHLFPEPGSIQPIRTYGIPLSLDGYSTRDPLAALPAPWTDPPAYCRCSGNLRPIGHPADGQPD